MNEHLNKNDWDVPSLSDEQISGIMQKAGRKLQRRQTNRRVFKGTMAACLLIAITATIYSFYPRSIDNELTTARQLIHEELNRKIEPHFFADGTNYEHSYEEASHGSILE